MSEETFEPIGSGDIAKDARINRFALELEAERQPSLMAEWGERLANAKKDRDNKEINLKTVMAEKGNHFRETLAKATADAVKDSVLASPEVQTAQRELVEADYLVSMLYSAVNAIEQKKGMIEALQKLYLGNYFSKPNDRSTTGTNFNESLNQKD